MSNPSIETLSKQKNLELNETLLLEYNNKVLNELYANRQNVLEKHNQKQYVPDTNFSPATKKYVDDAVKTKFDIIEKGEDNSLIFKSSQSENSKVIITPLDLGLMINDKDFNNTDNGSKILLDIVDECVKWKYENEEEWKYLISINQLQGPQGEQGLQGEQGPQGNPGIIPKLSIGEINIVKDENDVSAYITGTLENPILNLNIPKVEKTIKITQDVIDSLDSDELIPLSARQGKNLNERIKVVNEKISSVDSKIPQKVSQLQNDCDYISIERITKNENLEIFLSNSTSSIEYINSEYPDINNLQQALDEIFKEIKINSKNININSENININSNEIDINSKYTNSKYPNITTLQQALDEIFNGHIIDDEDDEIQKLNKGIIYKSDDKIPPDNKELLWWDNSEDDSEIVTSTLVNELINTIKGMKKEIDELKETVSNLSLVALNSSDNNNPDLASNYILASETGYFYASENGDYYVYENYNNDLLLEDYILSENDIIYASEDGSYYVYESYINNDQQFKDYILSENKDIYLSERNEYYTYE